MLAKKGLMTAPAAVAQYVEDVFSTYLYTGNGSTQTITNGIDLAGEGGLVWTKQRDSTRSNRLVDTVRGATYAISSNTTFAQAQQSSGLTAFNSNGYSLGSDTDYNTNASTFVGWTFRKAEKFFDVVTYTGDGTANRQISHNLGSTPGCIIVKSTSGGTSEWYVYHRGANNGVNADQYVLFLNSTNAQGNVSYFVPSSTHFTIANAGNANTNGWGFVAYLFAHDAGGFGDAGDQSVIKCGSYTGNGSATGPSIDLGWEPQWVMIKRTDSTGSWFMHDVMRGMPITNSFYITANTSDAETEGGIPVVSPNATGFQIATSASSWNANGGTYIYIAIRRGPMKTPEAGTEVFSPLAITPSSDSSRNITVIPDLLLYKYRTGTGSVTSEDRLRGFANTNGSTTGKLLLTSSTAAESSDFPFAYSIQNNSWLDGALLNGVSTVVYNFRRAPGFFDVVCYTGNSVTGRQVSHNLNVAPEMLWIANRNNGGGFNSYHVAVGNTKMMQLSTTGTPLTESWLNDTTPSATYFTVGGANESNNSSSTYVAYLFASCPGVSKVGSYTGTGTTLQVNCGFTGGARLVLIKRTDSTGDWYVWDTARGIVAGNDPYLLLNSTAAEVTNTDYIDTYSSGFEISSTAPAAINANGGTFIYLAVA